MTHEIGSSGYYFVNADCLKALPLIPDGSVNVVVTSPPYNIGTAYSTYRDRRGRDEFLAWCEEWGTQLHRVLAEDGSFFLNVAGSPSAPTLPHRLAILFEEMFVLQNTFHWIKSISIERPATETLSVGHFKPINSYRYVNDCHEYVFHFSKSGKAPVDRLALGVPYQDDRRCRGNNWFVPYKTINSRAKERPHPATFPVQLAENCLRLHGVDDESLVMDPFVGIGSAARAAVNCGVQRFVGIDIDKVYLDTAINEAAAMLDGRVISGRIRKGVYDGRVKERERHAI